MKIKTLLAINLTIPIVLSLPAYFGQKMIPTNVSMIYTSENTDFGNTQYYLYYLIFILVFESVLPTACIVFFLLVNFILFKRIMSKKVEINPNNKSKVKKRELKFTRITVFLTCTFVFVHILDLISSMITRYLKNYVIINRNILSLTNFFRQFSALIIFFQYSFNSLIYMYMDTNIENLVKEFFKIK